MRCGPASTVKQALKRHWPWLKRVLTFAYFALVLYLVFRLSQKLEWNRVIESISALPGITLLLAISLSVASHGVYSCFDLLGRRLTGHQLGRAQTMVVTFVSYVGNLNFGSLIGAVGLRQRLYSKLGLSLGKILRVAATSMVTNWLGYCLLAAVLLISPVYSQLAEQRLPAPDVARLLGVVLLVAVLGYLLLTAFKPRSRWQIGRLDFQVPAFRFALTQFAISITNWLLMSSIIYVLLERRIGFELVLFTLLVAAIAGVITHVPAGLGVIEAGFLLLLGDLMKPEALVAALLAYRAVYYLLPLVPAAIIWIWMESRK